MDINSIIRDVIMLVLVPLAGIEVRALAAYLKGKTDNANIEKYIGLAENAVSQAVEYVAQTYVDALKKARDALTAAIKCGAVQGDDNGELHLSYKDLRTIVREDRCWLYD